MSSGSTQLMSLMLFIPKSERNSPKRQRECEKDKSWQSKSNKPRLRLTPQEFHCCCLNISGMYCLLCKGEGEDCPACKCNCSVGWFKNSQRESLSKHTFSEDNGIEPNERPNTTSDNVGSFANAFITSLQNGHRDVNHTKMTVTNNAILGASARHMAEYTPTAEERTMLARQWGDQPLHSLMGGTCRSIKPFLRTIEPSTTLPVLLPLRPLLLLMLLMALIKLFL